MVTDDFAAVIDGSTSKTAVHYAPTMRNGRYAMTLVGNLIATGLQPDADVETFCRLATDSIRQCYVDQHADLDKLKAHPVERITCSAVVYSNARHELWFVGDCQALDVTHGMHYEHNKPYEQPIAEIRSARIRLGLLDGKSIEDYRHHDEGRDYILPLLRDYCKYQNVTYPVVDGFAIPMHTVQVVSLPDSTHEVALASDGYPLLAPCLQDSEAQLTELLHNDPLLIHEVKATKGWMKGNKSFDDRAYVRLRV